MLLCNILSSLDLRFADHKVESLYYNYYAQVKRNLLPTAIQVVLSVNILQLFATFIHFYLLTTTSISNNNINSNNNNTYSDNNATTLQEQDNYPSLSSNSNNATTDSSSHKYLIIPLILQLIILIATFTLLKVVRAELNPRKAVDKLSRRRFSSGATGRSSGGGAAGIEISTRNDCNNSLASSSSSTTSSRNSDDDDEDDTDDGGSEDAALKSSERDKKRIGSDEGTRGGNSNAHNNNNDGGKSKTNSGSCVLVRNEKNNKKSEGGRRRRSSFSPTKLSRCKLLLPYLLWFCQLIQLTSGLWPQQSFISYSMLLLYSYTIYVIFPIRLMSCIMLALGLILSQPILDHLLLFNFQKSVSSNINSHIQDIISSSTATSLYLSTSESDIVETSSSSPFHSAFNNSASSSSINDNSLLIPMTSQLSKLWAFMILAIGVNVIGIMSFFFYERQQRAAFLETRQSLETKLTLEQESQEQVSISVLFILNHN